MSLGNKVVKKNSEARERAPCRNVLELFCRSQRLGHTWWSPCSFQTLCYLKHFFGKSKIWKKKFEFWLFGRRRLGTRNMTPSLLCTGPCRSTTILWFFVWDACSFVGTLSEGCNLECWNDDMSSVGFCFVSENDFLIPLHLSLSLVPRQAGESGSIKNQLYVCSVARYQQELIPNCCALRFN